MDQLLAMRTFVRIAESGTFAKAADQLSLPRSTVSKLIADLEDHLGTKLIQRTTRTATVTPEGAEYYERISRLINELQDIDAAARQTKAQPKGRLRVDIGSSLANLILIPALGDFQERYPDVDIRLGVSDRPVDLVSENVDCVIRGGALSDTTLIARRICELDYVTCATVAYVERHGMPNHPTDIETGHNVLSYFSSLTGKAFPLLFRKGDEAYEISARSMAAVNESTAHMTAVVAGLGMSQTFRFMAQPYLDEGTLVPMLEDWGRSFHPLYVVYPPNRHLNARVRVFVDWVTDVFARFDAGKTAAAETRSTPYFTSI
ncbi:LysR family transcriptional regulator [Neorhizobium galegae]|uniref:LysR family transcriptional regulator n=1 Tax=Neorhizobium galegae TaxID=399 RepID=UPI0021017DA5|nr:LysR family transcriptional regulator [Neorhizobium galegae]MCQ1571542.1 LysR family transcriptional regulator [Neorhizobium galegae]MCQ1837833.1 LysR family transcriptional regulator [Neorhizobium galegae]UIY31571.1 LysR family transcriptional regulator [Neorhizobium galegae]